jgi:hypothetical protein
LISSGNEAGYDLGRFAVIPIKTRNHRVEHGAGVELFQIEWMTRPISQPGEERKLRTAVSLTERVDDIQLCKEVRGLRRKLGRGQMVMNGTIVGKV